MVISSPEKKESHHIFIENPPSKNFACFQTPVFKISFTLFWKILSESCFETNNVTAVCDISPILID